ncbi:MAG: alkaline phosphatase [Bacteroidetes bacterium]|nr:alkaline phosphatase [Bacteroidota bacterium]MBU1680430.1 alkaline phosphatase [Bacteroidota bacterium]MBU2506297.1 alkaline phosphatase [Bacteroidota bacterium]
MHKSKYALIILSLLVFSTSCVEKVNEYKKGNVIFIHPDGTGLATWNALRILTKGADGNLNWDNLPAIGLYRSHTKNSITTSSNAGATMHAYGVKVPYHSYGMNETEELTSLSGKRMGIMREAQFQGIKVGIINSGSIIEPGTGVFTASEIKRDMYESIAKKIVQSGADVILSGGEEWLLPIGVNGRFGEGKRTDGLDLVDWAKQNKYKVVFNRKELLALGSDVEKVLGVFAYVNTFNDMEEEEQQKLNLPHFNPEAPTLAEMTESAIKILAKNNSQFFLVVEEEATDNFPNYNNASGTLEALRRADEAINVAQNFLKTNPNTLLFVASDSEAGGMEVIGPPSQWLLEDSPLPKSDKNGAPADGPDGTSSLPFMSAPDQFGNSYPFYIAWSTLYDGYGGVVARADGLNSEFCKGSFDNTDVYRIMYLTLFGTNLWK